MFIVNKVVARGRRRPKIVLHSQHCAQSASMYAPNSPKDLRYIYDRFPGFDNRNTFIIDDLPAVCAAQPHNCINILPFDVETCQNVKDDQLERIQSALARAIAA